MSSRKTADLMFGVSLSCTLAFGISQVWTMLHSTTGVNVTTFVPMAIFFGLNTHLSHMAYRYAPSRILAQTRISYLFWMLTMVSLIIVQLFSQVRWTGTDSWLTSLVLIASSILTLWSLQQKLSMNDPAVKGLLAVICKATPQFLLAIHLMIAGSAKGLALVAVVAGLTTMTIRLLQLIVAIREVGWERNLKWSAISELANVVSWLTVTVTWMMVRS